MWFLRSIVVKLGATHWNLAPWRVALVAVLIVSFALEVIVSLRSTHKGNPALSTLRAMGILCVALLLLEPSVMRPIPGADKPAPVVLFDRSASMSIQDHAPGEPAQHRFKRVQTQWAQRTRTPDVQRFGFGDDLIPASPGNPFPETPSQSHSRLDMALRALARQPKPLSGVLVLSDGLVATDATAMNALAQASQALGVPLNYVNMSAAQRKDLALTDPQIPEFCFAQNASEIEVTLKREQVKQDRHRVELWQDAQLIESKTAVFAPHERQVRVTFRHTPQRVGSFVYRVRVHGVDGEATLANNSLDRVVSVLRDKVRVLHVAGRPDWDVRALRTLLKRNPNVELLSYYILRDEEDQMRDDPNAPMSLIQFPHQELFEEQLGSFDLIILQNFDATARANYNRNFGQFVLDGGAIAVIGGDLGLSTGDYAAPPFSTILPVRARVEPMRPGPIRTQLTQEGRQHPISAWMKQLAKPEGLRLPPLDHFNRSDATEPVKDKARVLLETTGQPSYPMLVVAEPGKGRILQLLTGSSWRWGFAPNLNLMQGLRPYEGLWQEIIRWSLREDPAPLSVTASSRLLTSMQPWSVTIQTRLADASPDPNVPVHIEIKDLDEDTQPVVASLSTDAQGQAVYNGEPRAAGRLLITVRRTGQSEGDQEIAAQTTVVIGANNPDFNQLNPDLFEARLREICRASSGRYWRYPKIPDDALDAMATGPAHTRSAVSRGQMQPMALWSHPLVWLGLLALPIEWWIRRRRGLDGHHRPS